MTEQKIEKLTLDHFEAALSAAQISGIQLIGAWQAADENQLKAFEDGKVDGVLGVKAYPRQFETPTVPDGSIQVDVSLTMRAEVDFNGAKWLAVVEAITNLLQKWQKSYQNYAPDFRIENEFEPTGYNIAGGDCGLDAANRIWQFSQSFNLYGIFCCATN